MINIVWQGFPRFLVAFVIKRLLYIEFKVFRNKKKGAGGAENAQKGYYILGGLGRDSGFLCRDRAF